MVPPKLTVVSDNTRDKDGSPSMDEKPAGSAAARQGVVVPDPEAVVETLARRAQREKLRRIEALLFASSQPVELSALQRCVEPGDDIGALIAELQKDYADRGVNLVKVAGKWQFRTAQDLSFLLERETREERKLSKAALETMAIIAYHQPVTRAEIEEIRGVAISPGTLDLLLETAWIRPRGRRRAPGRPITYGTTELFLQHFGLDTIKDLPGLAELKASGLLDANLPPDFKVPEPTDIAALMPDELPLEDDGPQEDQASFDLQPMDEPEIDEPEEPAESSAAEPAAVTEKNETDGGSDGKD
jgi:segregation and condensation protein B